MSLSRYHNKRDFAKTPEPKGRMHHRNQYRFYIQKHAASHLHYDFRIELAGVLKSWAVPKGPSLDPAIKRLAMQVEDHPIEYGTFEGIIPKGEYGGGTVMLWDEGKWEPLDSNPLMAFERGHLRFELHAKKLNGRWDLIRFKKEDNAWFLIKYEDDYARKDTYEITLAKPNSVLSEQPIEEIAANYTAIWTKKGKEQVKAVKPTKKISSLKLPPTPMPEKMSPQLATLVDNPPVGDNWLHEVKFDGYRILAFKNGMEVKLLSRNGLEWTKQFKKIAEDIKKLSINYAIFDGEVVLFDEYSRSNFQLLQNALKAGKNLPFFYYIFDLIYYEKWDVRSLPLVERKNLLEPLLNVKASSLRYSDHIIGHGAEFFKKGCDFALEGIISKRIDSTYITKRSKNWLKVKCLKRQEFVVGGFSPPRNARSHFGALYLGVYDKQDNLVFTGKVGTGFTDQSLKDIYTQLEKLITPDNPFSTRPPGIKKATWVKPSLVAEIEFTEWTKDGHLRHPSFKGLCKDKKAKEVKKEEEKRVEEVLNKKRGDAGDNTYVKLTNPNKILYKEDKISKQDLFNYYQEIASVILPFIKDRPLTLVRCPNDYKDCFYQKKLHDSTTNKAIHTIEIADSIGEKENYIYIDNEKGLLSLVQLGVLEIHPWNSHIQSVEYPDLITFDLDPAPDVAWKEVVNAAFEVRHHLAEFQLKSFVKTTGGKGLHVVIPILPEYDWDTVKNFTRVFVEFLVRLSPKKYLGEMSKAKRKGKIFIDYLRNQRGATAIAAYSTRARAHAPVSTPVHWEELTANLKDSYFTIQTLPDRLAKLSNDPWEEFWSTKQSLRLKEIDSLNN